MPIAYQVTKEDLIKLKNMKLGERIKWIRKMASDNNNGVYTQAKVAKDIGVITSSIAKLETGSTKNPSLEVLQNLSEYFSIPISVFFDVYYEQPEQFSIFGSNDKQLNNDPLFKQNYQAHISCTINSLNSEHEFTINETLHLSSLELDEFQEEIIFIVNKARRRQKSWSNKIVALKNLQNKKEGREKND